MSLRQVKELVKQHNIRGMSHLNLKELKDVLADRGIEIPAREPRAKRNTLVNQATETEEVASEGEIIEVQPVKEVVRKRVAKRTEPVASEIVEDKPVAEEKATDYTRLKTIRNSPRRVKITDVETNDEKEFQSMFAAGKFLGNSSKIITDYDNKVYGNKYKIEILTPTNNVGAD